MSTDDTQQDESAPWVARQAGRLRALAGATAAVSLGALAGCNSGSDTSDATATTSESPAQSGAGTAGGTGTTPTTGGSLSEDPAAGMSASECSDGLADLETELDDVLARQQALTETDLPGLRRRAEIRSDIAELFEQPPDDVRETADRVGKAARDAVVFLEFQNGMATGWFLDDHHIVTNAHNVFDHHGTGSARTATAWTFGGERLETTTVNYVDSLRPDVALLHTDAIAPATLTPGETPGRGSNDYLVQVGHPGGIGNWMRSLGRMRSTYQTQSPDGTMVTELETTIPGRQGVSGSPVLALDGTVVGLTYAGMPIRSKQPDDAPIVAPSVAYDRPVADLSLGSHVGIDPVLDYYDRWTK